MMVIFVLLCSLAFFVEPYTLTHSRHSRNYRSLISTSLSGIGNTFGRTFRVSTFGESHGKAVGCIIDGCPPRLPLSREIIQAELDRRRPGQSRITTPRNEADSCEIQSGVDLISNRTLGTPISIVVNNKDQRSGDYLKSDMLVAYRPSHADATYDAKYGVRAVAGGGRSSARETIGRVAAGAVAKMILKKVSGNMNAKSKLIFTQKTYPKTVLAQQR